MLRDSRENISRIVDKSDSFSGPPIVDGLVWRNEWKLPSEGALSLLWKIALANCITPHELCFRLFGRKLLVTDPAGMHGRTLLTPSWMSNEVDAETELCQMIRQSGMDMSSPGWASKVASDKHIKYCKACMSDGYHSVFCQIDGLITCPIHGLPLLDSCTNCGEPTLRYALTNLTMSNPFCCHVCGKPFGYRLWVPTANEPLKIYEAKYGTYRIFEDWLSNVEKLNISWPNLSYWQCYQEGKSDEIDRNIAVFAILSKLINIPLKSPSLSEPKYDIAMSVHDLIHFGLSDQEGYIVLSNLAKSKHDAYVSIRRRIWHLLLHRHRSCLHDGCKALQIEWGNEVLRPVAHVCPIVFAFFLWRHHFETNIVISQHLNTNNRNVELREAALAWPVDWKISTKGWCTFVITSFIAFAEVANEWCRRIENLSDPFGKSDSSSYMQLLTDFRTSLSPKYMAWTSRVTSFSSKYLKAPDVDSLVIVGPSGSLNEIMGQPCAVHSHINSKPKYGSVHLYFPYSVVEDFEKQDTDVDTKHHEVIISPIERLKVPPEIEGHGLLPRRYDKYDAKVFTDLEVVKIWLMEYEEKKSTHRSYRQAFERLINWALVERHKDISKLNGADLVDFEKFLANPQPRNRWISMHGTVRSDSKWTPFLGPLSPRSRKHTLTIIQVFFNWIGNRGSNEISELFRRHSDLWKIEPNSINVKVKQVETPKIIGIEEWRMLKSHLSDADNFKKNPYIRLAIEFMYYGALTITEVSNIQIDHIVNTKHAILLRIPNRSSNVSTIYLLPPVTMTLDELGIVGVTTINPFSHNGKTTTCESNPPKRIFNTASNLSKQIKSILKSTALDAAKDGNITTSNRLMSLTASSIQNAFESHVSELGCNNHWFWMLIGAANLQPKYIRQYLPKRKILSAHKLKIAIQSIAKCMGNF